MTSPPKLAQAVYQLPSSAFNEPALVNPGQEPGQRDVPTIDTLPTKGSMVLMEALADLAAAQPDYEKAKLFYEGEVGDLFATPNVQRLLASAGVNEVEDLNYAKVPVNTIVQKLQIRAVTVSAGDESDSQDDPAGDGGDETDPSKTSEAGRKKIAEAAQEKIDELRKHNQLDAEEEVLHLKASEFGDCYLFVWPVMELVETGADEETDEGFDGYIQIDERHRGRVVNVDMFVNSAETVRMFYDPENPLKPTHVIKSWQWLDLDSDSRRIRATLYFKDRIERWVTRPDGDAARPEDWLPYLAHDDSVWPEPNIRGKLPFYHYRTTRANSYGEPEHRAAYGPQRLINKLVSAHAVTIDYQSFPQRYALMNPKSDDVLQNLIDPDFPEDDDDDPEGTGRSPFRADPSAVWKIPGVSGVGQFSPADPAVFMNPFDRYIKSIAELTDTPLHRFTGYSQPPSGDSLKVANETLYEKAGTRQKNYGSVWADAYEDALELLGVTDVTVSVQWKPVESAGGAEDWNIVAAKIANGVPVKQALIEAGYPSDEVEKWLNDETGADLMRRVALLNSIGTAVQTLGAGVGLGVVSAEQVGDILARILGLSAAELPKLDKPVQLHPALAQQQMQLQGQQRGQQMAEHIATQGPQGSPNDRGGPNQNGGNGGGGSPPPLPPMPKPPPPVAVGT